MIIKKVSQIIESIIKFELQQIKKFEIKIQHGPTIGEQYESVTLKAIDSAIDEIFNLKVVSGFIKNSKGELSRQIDCIVCFGDGELIPNTNNKYIYNIYQVVAIVEVKKNLFSKEMQDAHKHLLEVNELNCDHNGLDTNLTQRLFKHFAEVSGVLLDSPDQISSIDNELIKMIYHSMVVQFTSPLRIIIGYEGFSSELSLREKFTQYLSLSHGKRGFGPTSLPDLIICGDNCLVKMNGEPYRSFIENGFWQFYGSSSGYNVKILAELLFSRISRYIPLDFCDDGDTEPIKYFLAANIINGKGWEYKYYKLDLNKITENPKDFEWSPTFVSVDAFILFNALCNGPITIENDLFVQTERKSPDILDQLLKTKFVALTKKNEICLISNNLVCVVTPKGEYIVGDDNHDYMKQWINKTYFSNN